eukprot:gb/GECG01015031.1/.p1 GENE.gb/GECG01015031.1/~~gb/GECG01015031.1/.p1  ORF type:complete len:992 (+),score=119.02 gb/GECG01015031.1/:1-2976(+)
MASMEQQTPTADDLEWARTQVNNLNRHRKFKKLALYSVSCILNMIQTSSNLDREKKIDACLNLGVLDSIRKLMNRHQADDDVFNLCMQCIEPMVSRPRAIIHSGIVDEVIEAIYEDEAFANRASVVKGLLENCSQAIEQISNKENTNGEHEAQTTEDDLDEMVQKRLRRITSVDAGYRAQKKSKVSKHRSSQRGNSNAKAIPPPPPKGAPSTAAKPGSQRPAKVLSDIYSLLVETRDLSTLPKYADEKCREKFKLVCSWNESELVSVEREYVELVVNRLTEEAASNEFTVDAIDHLVSLSRHHNNGYIFSEPWIIEPIVGLIAENPKNGDILSSVFQFIHETREKSSHDIIVESKCINSVTACLASATDVEKTVELCVGILSVLTLDTEEGQRQFLEEGIDVIRACVENHLGNEEIVGRGMCVLSNLILGSAETLSLVLESCGEIFVSVLRAHYKDEDLVLLTLRTVSCVSLYSENNRYMVEELCLVQHVCRVVEANKYEREVVETGIGLLGNLSIPESEPDPSETPIPLLVQEQGGPRVVISLLKENTEDSALTLMSLASLYNVCTDAQVAEQVQKAENLAAVLITVYKEYVGHDESIILNVMKLLDCLSVARSVSVQIVETGWVECLIEAMHHFSSSEETITWVERVLANLSFSPVVARSLQNSSIFDVLMASLQRFEKNVPSCIETMVLLTVSIDDVSLAESLLQNNFEVVKQLFSLHKTDKTFLRCLFCLLDNVLNASCDVIPMFIELDGMLLLTETVSLHPKATDVLVWTLGICGTIAESSEENAEFLREAGGVEMVEHVADAHKDHDKITEIANRVLSQFSSTSPPDATEENPASEKEHCGSSEAVTQGETDRESLSYIVNQLKRGVRMNVWWKGKPFSRIMVLGERNDCLRWRDTTKTVHHVTVDLKSLRKVEQTVETCHKKKWYLRKSVDPECCFVLYHGRLSSEKSYLACEAESSSVAQWCVSSLWELLTAFKANPRSIAEL